jgi:hypothetical protein
MDLPAVRVRVIRKVIDLEHLIAELTSPNCTLEALTVAIEDSVESLAFVEDDEIREQFAGALGASKTSKSLHVAFCSDMLKVDDLCTLLQCNEVLKSLTVCSRFAKSRSFIMMLKRNSTLKRLGIIFHSVDAYSYLTELLTELGGVLRSQSLLEQLTLDFSLWPWVFSPDLPWEALPKDTKLVLEKVNNDLSAAFFPNEASDNQANETLTLRLVLPLHVVRSIATILPSNRTIRELVLRQQDRQRHVTFSKGIVILLQGLEKNNTLRLLDLSGCSAVQERQDLYDAILNCLETKPWLHLNLQNTPLSKWKSRFTTIQQKLQHNAKFREAFGNWNSRLVNSTGARVFLCGSPGAGKCRSHLP